MKNRAYYVLVVLFLVAFVTSYGGCGAAAKKIIKEHSGTQFDPKLTEVFLSLV